MSAAAAKARPINCLPDTVARIASGQLVALRRYVPAPRGRPNTRSPFVGLAPGDLLWIREPFCLARKFDHLSPSAAIPLGARAFFPAQPLPADQRDQLGKQWPARAMPRAFHRHHLRVTDLREEPLKTITSAEIAAEGFTDRRAFACTWNANARTWGSPLYESDPTVLRIGFAYVAEPIPGFRAAECRSNR